MSGEIIDICFLAAPFLIVIICILGMIGVSRFSSVINKWIKFYYRDEIYYSYLKTARADIRQSYSNLGLCAPFYRRSKFLDYLELDGDPEKIEELKNKFKEYRK